MKKCKIFLFIYLTVNDIVVKSREGIVLFIKRLSDIKMPQKTPPEVLSPSEMAYMSGLNERDRRQFLTTRAESLRSQGFSYREFS